MLAEIQNFLGLLQIERQCEIEQSQAFRATRPIKSLQKEGLCVTKLEVESVKPGLFGRLLISLHRDNMPPHKLSNGDVLGIFTNNIGSPDATGILYKVGPTKLIIAASEFALSESRCSVVILANEVTYKKQKIALENVLSLKSSHYAYQLAQTLLLESSPRVSGSQRLIDYINPDLNDYQKKAIKFVLDEVSPLGIIHGPPGTGKTTTVVEVIVQAAQRGEKVLATAPSNIAVDNIVQKLSKTGLNICRLGHPARFLKSIAHFSFDNLIKNSDEQEVSNDIEKSIFNLNNDLKKASKTQAFEIRREISALRKDLKGRRGRAAEEVFQSSNVILSTNISAGERMLKQFADKIGGFDLLVLDEAAQALQASCWVPILLSRKVILAGDHQQLPPTVKSQEASKAGLSRTMMERLIESFPGASCLLQTQYRMNRQIMEWSNTEFYEGRLIADASVAEHTIQGYPPLMMVDTAGCHWYESGDESKYNLAEADIIKQIAEELAGVQVSVITPYNAQVQVIKNLGLKNLEVNSVDGFQGRQKDVILLSLVRSNPEFTVGFLSDYRRLNVAVTRARKMIYLICDGDTVAGRKSPDFLKNLINFFRQNAQLRNPTDFQIGIAEPLQKQQKIQEKKTKPKKKNKVAGVEILPQDNPVEKLKRRIQGFHRDRAEIFETEKIDGRTRAAVHDLASRLGLFHKTVGSGNKRKIVISKVQIEKNSSENEPGLQFEDEEVELRDEALIEDTQKSTKIVKQEPEVVEFNQEDFLDAIIEENKFCYAEGCRKPTVNIAKLCRFCGKTFCLTHGIAEAHGCGEKARVNARAQLFVEKPPKKPSIAETRGLKSKVQDKIKAMRPAKKPKKGKKKQFIQ